MTRSFATTRSNPLIDSTLRIHFRPRRPIAGEHPAASAVRMIGQLQMLDPSRPEHHQLETGRGLFRADDAPAATGRASAVGRSSAPPTPLDARRQLVGGVGSESVECYL